MLNGKVFLPIIGQALIEGTVLVLGYVMRVPRPDWLSFVELLVLDGDFLNLLLLLRPVFCIVFDLLDLGLLLAVVVVIYLLGDG